LSQGGTSGGLGLRIIGGFKLISATALVGLGIGVFRYIGGDPGQEAAHFVAKLKLDPENHYIHSAIEFVSGVKPNQLRAIGFGTFAYALLYAVEGVGLLLRKHWAEYFTVIATGSLIPFEAYEVYRKTTPIRLSVLAVNVAIVAYLIYQIRKPGRDPGQPEAPAPTRA